MAWAGDNAIEIGQPIVEGGAAQFVSRFGGGMHSVALQVEDLEATMAHLQQQEVHIAARPRPEMCFTDPRDTGGVFFQWSTFELAVDPRFGGARPATATAARARAGHAARLRRRAGRRPRRLGRPLRRAARHRRHLRARRAPRRASPWRACRSATAPSPSTRCPGTTAGPCGAAPTSGRAPTSWRCASRTSRAATDALTHGRHHHRPLGGRPRRARPGRHRRRPDRAHRVTAPGRPAPLTSERLRRQPGSTRSSPDPHRLGRAARRRARARSPPPRPARRRFRPPAPRGR